MAAVVWGLPAVRCFSGSSEPLSAPPPRAGTARSDVSAAPPRPVPPPLTRTSAEWRGRRQAARGAQPRAPALAPPAGSPLSFSRGVAAPFEPSFPLTPPDSCRADNWKQRAGSLAGSSELRDPRRMESWEDGDVSSPGWKGTSYLDPYASVG